MNAQHPKGVAGFNFRDAIFSGLAYLGYIRLMCLLMCLALSAGLGFYVFSRAVYQSRAMVRFGIVNLPFGANGYEIARSMGETLSSRYMVERTALRLGLTKELGNFESIRDSYVPKIEVGITDGATIGITVYSYSPELIKTWQPAMIQEYQAYQISQSRDQREKYLQVYKDQLTALQTRINEENQAKFNFEEENAVTELFVRQSGLTQLPKDMIIARHQLDIMGRVKKKLADSRLDSVEKLSLLSTLDKEMKLEVGSVVPKPVNPPQPGATLETLVPTGADPNSTVVVLPSMVNALEPWQELDKDLRKLTQEYHEAEKTYLPGHRKMVALNQQMDRLRDGLKAELGIMTSRFELEYARLTENLTNLEKQLPDYREVTQKYNNFRQQYALRQSGTVAWDTAYAALAKQMAEAEFRGDKQPVDLEFLGFSLMRDDPVSPSKQKLLLISLALGLALAVGIPFGLEKLNDTVSQLEMAEGSLNTPALGVIPVYAPAELEEMVRASGKDAEVPDRLFENFRLIRASIALNRARPTATQVIMVSSARPREGKTTVSLNLAWAFASMGERTLLLDCDLRRGRVHRAAKLSNEKGMSNVLKDKQDWREVVQSTTIPNLDVISRGPIRNGATEMLCRSEFAELMAEWRQTYARVILDTPPLLGLSEASSLQRIVDGLVLVILAESTPLKDAKQAIELVIKSGGTLYGFVLNRLDLRKAKNYYNYYYYSPYFYTALEQGAAH